MHNSRSKRENAKKSKALYLAQRQKVGGGNRGECPTPWKEPYVSRRVARTRLQSSPRRAGERLTVYHCICGGWHIGKQVLGSREQSREVATRKMAQKKGGPEGPP